MFFFREKHDFSAAAAPGHKAPPNYGAPKTMGPDGKIEPPSQLL